MNLRDFLALLDRRGSDLAEWPAQCREEAEALLASHAGARDALRTARRLDLLLADALNETDNAAERQLIARTLRAIDHETPRPLRRLGDWLWPRRRISRWARAVLACLLPLATGFALGVSSAGDTTADLAQLSQSAFVAIDDRPASP